MPYEFENLLQRTFGESYFARQTFSVGGELVGDSGKRYTVTREIVKQSSSFSFEVRDEHGRQAFLKHYDGEKRRAHFRDETTSFKTIEGGLTNEKGLLGVIKLYDTIEDKSCIFLEYFGKRTLEDKMYVDKNPRNFGLLEVLLTVLPLADTLSQLHCLGIAHRDLSPGNVLLAEGPKNRKKEMKEILKNDEIKLCDFGLSINNGYSAVHELTRPGFFMGTLKYCAPEIIGGEETGSYPADVWALGIILYDMLHPEGAFNSVNPRVIFSAIGSNTFPEMKELHGLGKLARSMLSAAQGDRPTMLQIRDELKSIYYNAEGEESSILNKCRGVWRFLRNPIL